MCLLGTFAQHTVVSEANCIKIEDDIALDKACLLGCGVVTGWGSAVNAAEVKPGHTVIVMGIGGIGINAVHGAAHAGASHVIAVDPVEFKREMAPTFGATHTAVDAAAALELVRKITWGVMADRVIRGAYTLLGLLTYFTVGPKETRAWTVRKGSTAPQAAGVIHTDFEKGFIKAETVSYDDLMAAGSMAAAKAAGKVRMEGKDYVMADGDIVDFRFNV